MLLLAEPISLRLGVASAAILGGIAIVLASRSHAAPVRPLSSGR